MRDWSFPYEADYGYSGGEAILKRRLEVQPAVSHCSTKQYVASVGSGQQHQQAAKVVLTT